MNSDDHSVDIVKKKSLHSWNRPRRRTKISGATPISALTQLVTMSMAQGHCTSRAKPPPAVGNSRYPQPDTLRWDRPRWQEKKEEKKKEKKEAATDDEKEEEEEEDEERRVRRVW